ncbi:Aste57867_21194 [Aphanomyces stellatus]|uniref:Aste57867_21194 protein n=1 Tax=Aphanomyces stellatus TaxID=120398 RepID=A0A485LHL2_9STRA|nr:hypothetical protein As57867_021126 [Aphanomyces stellatus]VFT97868.1 Aste57867_21194 [Aphanomyces stellatus]
MRKSSVSRPFSFSISSDNGGAHPISTPTLEEGASEATEATVWRNRVYHLILYAAVSLTTVFVLYFVSYFSAVVDGQAPTMVGCQDQAFWDGPTCGLHGIDCLPFQTDWAPIRCPSRCLWDGNPALQVIGSGPYKAVSRICRAAIHAGVMTANGGCAMMRFGGHANSFLASSANDVSTQAYDSWFPKTLEFKPATTVMHCDDLSSWIVSVGFFAVFGLVFFPLPLIALIHTLCIWGFYYVSMVTAPQSYDYGNIIIRLSTQLCIVVVAVHCWYHWVFQHTFEEFASYSLQRRAVVWGVYYLLPFHMMLHLTFVSNVPWLNIDLGGVHNKDVSYTWAYVAIVLLGLFFVVLIAILFKQLHTRKKLRWTLTCYIALTVYFAIIYGFFNTWIFHLHHVQFGLLLLPLTRTPTLPAFFAQGLGLGLFIQGYAAWGWPTFLDEVPSSYSVDMAERAPVALNVTATTANVTWEVLDNVVGYALMLNGVMQSRAGPTWTLLTDLEPNQKYYVQVSGVGRGGTDGQLSPRGNFTTANATTPAKATPGV